MTIRYKRILPLAAILLSGLASASTAFAQSPATSPSGPAPAPFCGPGESTFKLANGPKPQPSPAFAAAQNLVPATNIYGQTASNYHFGDTFTLPPGQITKISLVTRLQANATDAGNDGISFSATPNFTSGHFGFALNTLSPGWGTSGPGQQAKSFKFDFDASGAQVHVNAQPFAAGPPYNGATFYGDLTTNHLLHVYVEDDTRVYLVEIEGCVKPLPKYDLAVSKKREGSAYTIDVTNAGAQISPSGKIDLVEVVPAGLTILGANVPAPWQCPGVIFPVVGPDAFTCTYPINAVIPAGQHLPQIVLKSEGKSECPNCVRVRLYLKEVSGGQKPVDEGDMKNNMSCAK